MWEITASLLQTSAAGYDHVVGRITRLIHQLSQGCDELQRCREIKIIDVHRFFLFLVGLKLIGWITEAFQLNGVVSLDTACLRLH